MDFLGGLTEINAQEYQRNLERAELILLKILELSDGGALIVRLHLAQVLFDLGRPREALDMLQKYLNSAENAPERGAAERLLICLNTINAIAANLDKQDDIEPPKKIYHPAPGYVEVARKGRIQGVVIVQLLLDKKGKVACAKALKGLPLGLTSQALKTLRTWRFEPAKRHGDPVEVIYNMTINFELKTEKELKGEDRENRQ